MLDGMKISLDDGTLHDAAADLRRAAADLEGRSALIRGRADAAARAFGEHAGSSVSTAGRQVYEALSRLSLGYRRLADGLDVVNDRYRQVDRLTVPVTGRWQADRPTRR